MSAGRATILGTVRRALGRTDGDASARERIAERLQDHPLGPIPDRGSESGAAAVARFVKEAETAQAQIDRIDDIADLPALVAKSLSARNLPSRVRVAGDAMVADLAWSAASMMDMETGAADPADTASVSVARAGVAETGTLVLCADAANPGTLNSLPLHHIVVLPVERIVGNYEQVWQALRQAAMPRAVVWTTGPSRTADIEQTLLLGAHGPQSLQIVIVGDAPAET